MKKEKTSIFFDEKIKTILLKYKKKKQMSQSDIVNVFCYYLIEFVDIDLLLDYWNLEEMTTQHAIRRKGKEFFKIKRIKREKTLPV